MLNASQALEDAKQKVATLKEDPGNSAKLKLYALFKQATNGPCDTPKPGVFDFVGQAKWTAWNGLGDMSKLDAERNYIRYVQELARSNVEVQEIKPILNQVEANVPSNSNFGMTHKSMPTVKGLDIAVIDGVLSVTFNRPHKLNAITLEMFTCIRDTLNKAGNDPEVKICILTGVGDYYCSGNDMANFTKIPSLGGHGSDDFLKVLPQVAHTAVDNYIRTFVEAFIVFPKPLVCAVNGPAVGVAATLLGLCDIVYASDTATFHTPFMALGQSPEGCSSYTFPKIMGYARANDMLLGGRKITAQQAFDRGLVTEIFPKSDFINRVAEKIRMLSSLPPSSMLFGKALTRNQDLKTLLRVNIEECQRLEERWLSEECIQAVMGFLTKKT